ncbi:MAG TPA: peptidase U32 family protein, partial [Clostridiales bacterium]|nr:peptidase U32 family protein [Clostridiales bacterium]
MSEIEILAPVGGSEQLLAAVRCGADAVYLGTQSFNARRNAKNFDSQALYEAVAYCHIRGVKVYVTLNTLVFDFEIPELDKQIKEIARSGADAIIVQDMAVMSRVKAICPHIMLHASTQMAIHNISGAEILKKLGFGRVILARELSLDEIRIITQSIDI